jgi:uncharacterized membrane protein YeiH
MLAASIISPPLWIELSAIVAGALAGAVFSARRGLDLVGILAIAVVCGLGGGLIRDVLLATVPAALLDPTYLVAVVIAAVVGAFFATAVRFLRWPMTALDSLSLGLFAVIGTQKALNARLPVASAVLLGVITGIGGSVLRDVFAGVSPPTTFQRGSPFGTMAALAAVGYVTLVRVFGTTKLVAEIVVVVVVVMVRSVAILRGWTTPAAVDLTPARLRPRETPPSEDPPTREGPTTE